jgi:hypothetical protein
MAGQQSLAENLPLRHSSRTSLLRCTSLSCRLCCRRQVCCPRIGGNCSNACSLVRRIYDRNDRLLRRKLSVGICTAPSSYPIPPSLLERQFLSVRFRTGIELPCSNNTNGLVDAREQRSSTREMGFVSSFDIQRHTRIGSTVPAQQDVYPPRASISRHQLPEMPFARLQLLQ